MRGTLIAVVLTLLACSVNATKWYARPTCLKTALSQCKTFASLVQKESPELAKLLSNSWSSVTVFCPTDKALSQVKIPAGYSVADILKYHVVLGDVSSGSLLKRSPFKTTYNSKTIKAVKEGKYIKIVGDLSSAYPVKVDARCNKWGRVHVIDQVLIPSLPKPQACTTIYGALVATPDLSTLKAAVDAAGLKDTLNDPNLVSTVFAPTNKAFLDLLAALKTDLASLVANKDLLLAVLKNHVVPGAAVKSTQLSNNQKLSTLDNKNLIVNLYKGGVFVRSEFAETSYQVVKADIGVCKSIVHVINGVLVPTNPPSPPPPKPQACTTIYGALVATPDLSTLKAAVDAAGLKDLLNDPNFVSTVFAPTNKAFTDLLAALKTDLATLVANKDLLVSVLKNHVVPGAALKSNQLSNGGRYKTALDGKYLVVNVGNSGKTVTVRSEGTHDAFPVAIANVVTCKAVVHVITGVLVPK